jgi:hypothetical protein
MDSKENTIYIAVYGLKEFPCLASTYEMQSETRDSGEMQNESPAR